MTVINSGLFAKLKPFRIKVKWIPLSCCPPTNCSQMQHHFSVIRYFCLDSYWSPNSTGLLTRCSCPVLPSSRPVSTTVPEWSFWTGTSACAFPLLPQHGLQPSMPSPSAIPHHPSPPRPVSCPFSHTPHPLHSKPAVLFHSWLFHVLSPGVSTQYPQSPPSSLISINPSSVKTPWWGCPPIFPIPTRDIMDSGFLLALRAKLTLLGHYSYFIITICLLTCCHTGSWAFYFSKPGYPGQLSPINSC